MKDELLLTSLISSRICHDLISPIGAINNGLELLAMSGVADGEETALISESAKSAADSLRFLRIAFGAASTTEMMRAAEIASILTAHLTTQRLSIDWSAGEDDLSRSTARLILLMAQTGAAGSPLGGVLQIVSSVTAFPYEISLTGPKIGFEDAALAALNGGLELNRMEPRHAPLALFGLLARDEGFNIDWAAHGGEGRLRLA